ncbi:MAG: ABC transporter permease [Defluviitaleaceae bacterium]|nr:ABC transporter permease [Defluviitaleaceae bacterium]
MHKYILKRLLFMIPVLLSVMFVTFTLGYLAPGCPVLAAMPEGTPRHIIDARRDELGLNDPFFSQFFNHIGGIVTLDFGRSIFNDDPVAPQIFERFPLTMHLAAMSVLMALLIGIPLGIISATRQYSIFDGGATFIGLLGVSIPNFVLGLLLIMFFSVHLELLPVSAWRAGHWQDHPDWHHWILPAVTLGASGAAIIMRMTRSSMLETFRQDYIRTARAKGQSEMKIIMRHALKNALLPVITVAGLQFGFLLGGAILTETIFNLPGLGTFVFSAIGRRDMPVVFGGVFIIAVSFSIVNLLVDILYAFVDPRIRAQYR